MDVPTVFQGLITKWAKSLAIFNSTLCGESEITRTGKHRFHLQDLGSDENEEQANANQCPGLAAHVINSNNNNPTTSSPSSSSPSSPLLAYAADPRVKKHVIDSAVAARRCSHCGVQKTPQWRTGPLGAKTLCNACGVRFKSGRLLPEYRPACSPTFSIKLHSNHHRKVLEMRRKKEVTPEPDTSSPRSIPNF
ncbi:hypothetical protein JHK87_045153 [Glycine soja]|nr:hypothetical protein JHK87_045153 [Glycine soja]